MFTAIPRLILREQIGCGSSAWLFFKINIGERLSISVTDGRMRRRVRQLSKAEGSGILSRRAATLAIVTALLDAIHVFLTSSITWRWAF